MSDSPQRDKTLIARHPVAAYYAVTIAFTWAIQLPLVAAKQGWTGAPIPFWLHYLASLGPAVAALIVTAWTAGKEGLQELGRRITRWRVGWRWALFGVFGSRPSTRCEPTLLE